MAERSSTEQQLRRTQADLIQSAKLAALGQMLAELSHEFNQPLAALRSYLDSAQVLIARDRVPEAGRYLGRIGDLAERMTAISRNLSNFARKPGGHLTSVPVDQVVADALEILDWRIRADRVRVELQIPPLRVRAGRVRLQQVLVNILANALDAMEGEDRRIAIRAEVAAEPGGRPAPGPDAERVRIMLRDRGPGVPPAIVSRIVDPFFSTKGVGRGLGLGLSISQLAVRAMRDGAYDFVEKPFANTHLVDVVARACDRRRLILENRLLRAAAGHPDDIEQRLIGRSAAMIELREKLRAVGPTGADVLITGETGTDKEVAARALHDLSPRADKPFVAINCAALPSMMIESELFGHEVGAFPGAMRARYGKFELARGGTILLDEIGAMPLEVQAKLLRVIQERATTRLGTNETLPLDVRFIATSKEDLEREVAAGRFRSDLFYRLNVVTLRMPPLSERREDIPLLFLKLVNEAALRYRRDPVDVPAQVCAVIADRDWSGNVRELRNAADRFGLGLGIGFDAARQEAEPTLLADRMAAFERVTLVDALAAHAGNLEAVYDSLGLSRKALYLKIRRHGLDWRDFAPEEDED